MSAEIMIPRRRSVSLLWWCKPQMILSDESKDQFCFGGVKIKKLFLAQVNNRFIIISLFFLLNCTAQKWYYAITYNNPQWTYNYTPYISIPKNYFSSHIFIPVFQVWGLFFSLCPQHLSQTYWFIQISFLFSNKISVAKSVFMFMFTRNTGWSAWCLLKGDSLVALNVLNLTFFFYFIHKTYFFHSLPSLIQIFCLLYFNATQNFFVTFRQISYWPMLKNFYFLCSLISI